MTNLIVLTEKEQVAFTAIIKEGLTNICGSHPDDLLEDNCSWFYALDIVRLTDFSKHQIAGLIGSLLDKGLIGTDEPSVEGSACLFISETGLYHQIEFLG